MSNLNFVVVMLISNIACQIAIQGVVLLLVLLFVEVNSSLWLPSKKLLLEEEICRTINRRHKRDISGNPGVRLLHNAKVRQAKHPHGNKHQAHIPNKVSTEKPIIAGRAGISKFPVCYTLSRHPTTATRPHTGKPAGLTTSQKSFEFSCCYTLSRHPTTATKSRTKHTISSSSKHPTTVTSFSAEVETFSTKITYTSSEFPTTAISSSAQSTTLNIPTQETYSSGTYSVTSFPIGPSNILSSTEYSTFSPSTTQSTFSSSQSTQSSTQTAYSSTQPTTSRIRTQETSSSGTYSVTSVPMNPSNTLSSTEYSTISPSITQSTFSSSHSTQSSTLPTTSNIPTQDTSSSVTSSVTSFPIGPSNILSSTEYTTFSPSTTQSTFSISKSSHSSTQPTTSKFSTQDTSSSATYTVTSFPTEPSTEYTTSSQLTSQSTLSSSRTTLFITQTPHSSTQPTHSSTQSTHSSTHSTHSSTQSTHSSTQPMTTNFPTQQISSSATHSVTSFPIGPSNIPSSTDHTTPLSSTTQSPFSSSQSNHPSNQTTYSSSRLTISSFTTQDTSSSPTHSVTSFSIGPSNIISSTEYSTPSQSTAQTTFYSSQSTHFSTQSVHSSTQPTTSKFSTQDNSSNATYSVTFFPVGPSNLPSSTDHTTPLPSTIQLTFSNSQSTHLSHQTTYSSTRPTTSNFPTEGTSSRPTHSGTSFSIGPSNILSSTEYTTFSPSTTQSKFPSSQSSQSSMQTTYFNSKPTTSSFPAQDTSSSATYAVTSTPMRPSNIPSSTEYTTFLPSTSKSSHSGTQTTYSSTLPTTSNFPTEGTSSSSTYTVTNSPMRPSNIPSSTEQTPFSPITSQSTFSSVHTTYSSTQTTTPTFPTKETSSSASYSVTSFPMRPSNMLSSTEHTIFSPSTSPSTYSSTQPTTSTFPTEETYSSAMYSVTSFPLIHSNIPSSTEYYTSSPSTTQSTFSSTQSATKSASKFSASPSTKPAFTDFPIRASNIPTSTEFTTEPLPSSTEATPSSTEFPARTIPLLNSQFPSNTQTYTNFPNKPTTDYTTIASSSPQFSFSITQFPSAASMPATNPNMLVSTNLPIQTTDYTTSPFPTSRSSVSVPHTSEYISSSATTEQTPLPTTTATNSRFTTTDYETTLGFSFPIPLPVSTPIIHGPSYNFFQQTFSTTESPYLSSTDSTTEMPSSHTTIFTTESTPISSEYPEYFTTERPRITEPYSLTTFSATSNPILIGSTNFPLQQKSTTEPVVEPVTEDWTTEEPITEPPVTEPPVTKPPVTKPPVTNPPKTEPPITKPPTTKKPTSKIPATTDDSLISRTPAPPVPTEPSSNCSQYEINTHADKCACFSDNKCRLDENGQNCVADYDICSRFHPDPDKECIRTPTGEQAEIFYIYAGTPCPRNKLHRRKRSLNFLRRFRIGTMVTIEKEDGNHSKASNPHCKVEETLLAVNLGRDQKHVDGYGIQYMADNEVPWIDPNNTRKYDISLHLNGVDKRDMWLYRWQIWGDWNKKGVGGHCVIYEVPLGKDGQHELNMKMIDNYWARKGTRGFNVRFNGINILPEIDLIHITRKQFRAVDIILNFEVAGHGKQLSMPGFPNSEIRDGFVELKFCYGECNSTDEDYHVAGFSIVRFEKPGENSSCNQYRRLPCLCKKQGCQYHLETGDCRKLEECPSRMFRHNECKRVNAFYSNGGVLCQNPRGGGSCLVGETIKAINFHGEATDDRRTGIKYEPDRNIGIGRIIDFATECSEVNTKASDLYCFYTEAHLDTKPKEICLEYKIPIVLDGSYELSLKTGEFKFDNRGDRTFNVKFNGEEILREFDIMEYAEKNKAIDVNILFTVLDNGSVIWMYGYGLRRIDGKLKLQFCNGEWYKRDGSWILSAFSIVRFEYSFRNTSAYTFSA